MPARCGIVLMIHFICFDELTGSNDHIAIIGLSLKFLVDDYQLNCTIHDGLVFQAKRQMSFVYTSGDKSCLLRFCDWSDVA